MSSDSLNSLDAVRAWITHASAPLDPQSRYIRELLAIVSESTTVAELEARLVSGCRGSRHAGVDVFANMSLKDKLRANLITAETELFRFAEGELEASRTVLAARGGEHIRVLIVPCSHGEEAFTMAAFLLGEDARFAIRAFDVQAALIAEARTGRLTFGFPLRHLESPGYVGRDVLDRITFECGDAFDLPLGDDDMFDLVLCRNFLGYFIPEKAAALTGALARRLAPSGRLFLDSFCLGKLPSISRALEDAALTRVAGQPVFSRA